MGGVWPLMVPLHLFLINYIVIVLNGITHLRCMITVRVATILKIDKLWYNSQKNSMFSFSDMIKINIVKRSKLNILLIQIKVVNSVSVGILFFSIEMECFSFEMFRRAVSGLYCSYIYIYIIIYIFRGWIIYIYIIQQI